MTHGNEANRNSNGSMVHRLATQIGATLPGPLAAIAAPTGLILPQAGLSRRSKRAALCLSRQQSRVGCTITIT